MAISVDSNPQSVDSIRSLSRCVMKRIPAVEVSTTGSKTKEFTPALCSSSSSCFVSFPLRMLLLIICTLIITVIVFFSRDVLVTTSPTPAATDLDWSVDNILPGVPDSDVVLAGPVSNSTLLTLSAIDPYQTQMKKEVIRYLNPGLSKTLHEFYRAGARNFNLEIARTELAGVPLYLASRKLDDMWPEFQRRVRKWAFGKRFEPTVMKNLMSDIKAPLDKHYGIKSKDVKYKRCAVVGNSGILLSQKYGSFIDSHDMVVRLNNARTFQFEPYVGSKTTLSFINSNILHECFNRIRCRCHPYGENVPIAMYVCQVAHLMDASLCSKEHKAPLFVTDPRFDTVLARLVKWYSLKDFIDNKHEPAWEWDRHHDSVSFHYSSGFQAVIMSLGICDEVNLFGFGKNESFPHHYHTHQKAELDVHDYAAEYSFYDDLVNRRIQSIPFLKDSGIDIPPVKVYR